jgi:hypothetical protein
MDYPSESVMARGSALVELYWAKHGFCFRRFLTKIFPVKCTTEKISRFFAALDAVGWVWKPSLCGYRRGEWLPLI